MKKSRKIFCDNKDGRLVINEKDRMYIKKFKEKYNNQQIWIQLGVKEEEDERYRKWLNYWFGIVCKIIADELSGGDIEYTQEVLSIFFPEQITPEEIKELYDIFGFAKKEYVHGCLKRAFFETKKDSKTGLPIKKSFALDGNVCVDEIARKMPYIQRWAKEELNIDIPDIGEGIEYETGEIIEQDISNDKEYKKEKKEEKKLWSKYRKNDSLAGFSDDFY